MIGVELLTENLCKLVCHLSTLMACHLTTDKHCKPTEMRSSLQGQIMSGACPGKPSKKCWPTLQQWISLYLLQWVPRLLQQLPKPLQIAPTSGGIPQKRFEHHHEIEAKPAEALACVILWNMQSLWTPICAENRAVLQFALWLQMMENYWFMNCSRNSERDW